MFYAKKEANVKNLGMIFYIEGPHDESLKTLNYLGASPITSSQLAYARMQKGINSSLSRYKSYVSEGILDVPYGIVTKILLRDSLVLQNPGEAFFAHRSDSEYYLGESFDVRRFIDNLPKDAYLNLLDLSPVPTNSFGDDERMVWLFGEHAKDYGLFLKNAGILKIKFCVDDPNMKRLKQPYANQLSLSGLKGNSNIICNGDLSSYDRIRGVCLESDEDNTQENACSREKMYSKEDLVSRLHKVGILVPGSDSEKLVLKEFEK